MNTIPTSSGCACRCHSDLQYRNEKRFKQVCRVCFHKHKEGHMLSLMWYRCYDSLCEQGHT
jgi:hypothetical protein